MKDVMSERRIDLRRIVGGIALLACIAIIMFLVNRGCSVSEENSLDVRSTDTHLPSAAPITKGSSGNDQASSSTDSDQSKESAADASKTELHATQSFKTARADYIKLLDQPALISQRPKLLSFLNDADAIFREADEQFKLNIGPFASHRSSLNWGLVDISELNETIVGAHLSQAVGVMKDLPTTSKSQLKDSVRQWIEDLRPKLLQAAPKLEGYANQPEAALACRLDPAILRLRLTKARALEEEAEEAINHDVDITGAWIDIVHADLLQSTVSMDLTCFDSWKESGLAGQPGKP